MRKVATYISIFLVLTAGINSYSQSNYFEYFQKSFKDPTIKNLQFSQFPIRFYKMIYLSDTVKKTCMIDFYAGNFAKGKTLTCGCTRKGVMYNIMVFGKTQNQILFAIIVRRGYSENYLFTYDTKHKIFGKLEFEGKYFLGFEKPYKLESFKSFEFSPFSIYKWDKRKCILAHKSVDIWKSEEELEKK
jgi:hypothetical protein